MNSEQITNIVFKLGEVSHKADNAVLVALIAGAVAVATALLAGYFKIVSDTREKQHQKQWTYLAKQTQLIDAATEIFPRMLFNKLILASKDDATAAANLLVLQKDVLVVESQLVVYGAQAIADAVYKYKNLILNTPNAEFVQRWGELYKEGNECLVLCRRHLGDEIGKDFEAFKGALSQAPVLEDQVVGAVASTMGTVQINTRNSGL